MALHGWTYYQGEVACIYNVATLEAQFRNSIYSVPVGGNLVLQ